MNLITSALVAAVLWSQAAPPACAGRDARKEGAVLSVQAENREEAQTAARRVWEQAIEAKGGRERLHALRNMLISGEVGYTTRRAKGNKARRTYLLVFPGKYWSFEDYGSDVFGSQVHMFDYEAKTQYVGRPGDPEMRLEPLSNPNNDRTMEDQTLAFLLETKWLKPTPLKVTGEVIGSRPVDVVETSTPAGRVDFAFDGRTHLPVRVSFYTTYRGKTYVTVQSFSDYTEVSGIKVPRVVEYKDGTKDDLSIEFNVEYDNSIFKTPPRAQAGRDVWRPKAGS